MSNPVTEINTFLQQRGSPLAGKGAVFVREGRKNGIDPKLLVAIAGAESDFGKHGPIQPIHNPFGWGPHIKFKSWDQAISTVARGLRKGYLDEGLKTISQIGAKWAPQGAANDPTNLNSNWAKNVGRFYAELDGTGVATKPVTTAVPTTPGVPSMPTELPTNAPDLAGLALSNLSQIASGGRQQSPLDMLSGLTSAVAAQPPKLAAPPLAPAPSSMPGAPEPQEPSAAGGFNPQFKSALDRLLEAAQGKLTVTSGYRSPDRQAELFAAAVKKYGSESAARKWVAPPGKSKHNHGVAADLGGDLSVLNDQFLRKFGLYRPMSYEPWHVEPIGSRR